MTAPISSPVMHQAARPTMVDDTASGISELKNVSKVYYSVQLIENVAENCGSVKAQSVPPTDDEVKDIIKSNAPAGTFALLSEQDQKWLSIAVELFRVLSADSLSQRAIRDKMEEVVKKLAEKLKEHKYKEANIQVRAAIAGAVASVVVAVAGAAFSVKGLKVNPDGVSLQSIRGQTLSSLTQSANNLVTQVMMADATREQGEAELTRAAKESVQSNMSAHSKSADTQQELVRKIMDLVNRFFEARMATQSQLISNART